MLTLLIPALIGFFIAGKDGAVTGLLLGLLVEVVCLAFDKKG